MTQIEARKIIQNEVNTFRRIGAYAFTSWKDEQDPWEPTPAQLDKMLAVFVDGTIAAKLSNHTFEQIVRGVWRSASGIGGVATLPEFRRKGLMRLLFDAAFADMRAKGHAVSVLHPFSHEFYGKFGYVCTNPFPRLRIKSSALQHLIPLTDGAGTTWRYQRVRAIDAVEPYKEFIHHVATHPNRSRDYNGYMRDLNFDADNCANQHMIFVKENFVDEQSGEQSERIVAAALYGLEKYSDPQGVTLVNDSHWLDASARDRLLAFFALHAAGLPYLQIRLPIQTKFHSWLSDSPDEYKTQLSHLPIMVRVLDVVQVLDGLSVASGGSRETLTIEVRDKTCPWVGGTFELVEANGLLNAQRVDGSAAITMSIEGLTMLAYGTLPVDEIVYRGELSGANAEQINLLERWFPEESVFSLLFF